MRAIETKWKGYRFRSRTEARWAVFLEALGVTFQYEPEGIILPSGPYLPDFRLTSFPIGIFPEGRAWQDVWLEVKGDEPTDLEIQKCAELSKEANTPVLLAVGAPDFGPQVLLFDDRIEDVVIELIPRLVGYLTFIDVGRGEEAAIAVGRPKRADDEEVDPADDPHFEAAWRSFSGPFARVLGVEGARFVSNELIDFNLSPRIKAAYDAARSARFEFGQADPRWPTA